MVIGFSDLWLEHARLILSFQAIAEIRAKIAENENLKTSLSQHIAEIDEQITREQDSTTRDRLTQDSAQGKQKLTSAINELEQQRVEESARTSELRESSDRLNNRRFP